LIDEGETDWKIIAIDVHDARAHEFNDVDDVLHKLPGFGYATYEWFRTYKIPTGKPPNTFAFNGEIKNKAYALGVIQENNHFWTQLITGEVPRQTDRYNLAIENTSVDGSAARVEGFSYEKKEFVASAAIPDNVYDSTGVKAHVEAQQRASPHGIAQLSAAVSALAAAAAKGATDGASGLSSTLLNGPFAAVHSSTSDAALGGNDQQYHYTVFFHADEAKGQVVFGLYQKISPNPVFFNGAEAVHAAGYDLVAAAYASNGVFTYTTGHGVFSFTTAGPAENPATPSFDSDHLLAVKAPLALFQ